MNRHLVFKMSCFRVAELRNSPAITRVPRLEPEHFNDNLFDPDLIRGSLVNPFGGIGIDFLFIMTREYIYHRGRGKVNSIAGTTLPYFLCHNILLQKADT